MAFLSNIPMEPIIADKLVKKSHFRDGSIPSNLSCGGNGELRGQGEYYGYIACNLFCDENQYIQFYGFMDE